MRHTRYWLVGCIIVVLLLGHSVLMLGAAHAALHPLAGLAHQSLAGRQDARLLDRVETTTTMEQHPRPQELDGCNTVLPLLPRRDDTAPDTPVIPASTNHAVQASIHSNAMAAPRVAPDLPSSVRRALLQVYRI